MMGDPIVGEPRIYERKKKFIPESQDFLGAHYPMQCDLSFVQHRLMVLASDSLCE